MKILMHICCGPCSLYCMDVMKKENIEVTGLFANPNIHPRDEYLRRMESTRQACAYKNVPLEITDCYDEESWKKYSTGDKSRCLMCYEKRLELTAERAKQEGFDGFTTTLLVSPYQNHELLKKTGEDIAGKMGLTFYYYDFREGFRKGQNEAKLIGLYRQKYCGCILSLEEAERERENGRK